MDLFYRRPILNSPYVCPDRHWDLDNDNRPTNRIVESRRPSSYVSPIPAARKTSDKQLALVPDDVATALQTSDQQYDLTEFINGVRRAVDRWRTLPEREWRVTAETARLLQHWRHHRFTDIRPFFCQVEAVETIIWLTEVHPRVLKLATWVRLDPFSNWPTPVAAGASELPRPSTQGRIVIEVKPQPKRFHGPRWLTATLDCAVDRAYAARAAVAAMEP